MSEEPIRIFIGTEPKTEIPCQVLEYSIKKHASMPVEITRMVGKKWEPPAIRQGTGFSLRRWMIPQVGCDFKGKAIYMDADQLVMGDIAELWYMDRTHENDAAVVWCAYDHDKYTKRHLKSKRMAMQSSVMLIDCERASYWTPEFMWPFLLEKKMSYIAFMHAEWFRPKGIQEIARVWNQFNAYEPSKTRLVHYTVEKTQPWYQPQNPCAWIWKEMLAEAIKAGAISKDDFQQAIKRFGKPDRVDHRKTYGIHPKFAPMLELFS